MSTQVSTPPLPLLQPLGDQALLVRFGDTLSAEANSAAIGFARRAAAVALPGVVEIVPNLISVLLRYDAAHVGFTALAGEVRLLFAPRSLAAGAGGLHRLEADFDGEDLADAAEALGLSPEAFISAHNAKPLRVLATGFAPGFVYCGFHADRLHLPRRRAVRPLVPAGTVLFAAGQTAIASTPVPTGWHVIGHTRFRNFDPYAEPPTRLTAGDEVRFEAIA